MPASDFREFQDYQSELGVRARSIEFMCVTAL
eukprot:CAMPEP_0206007572 /NCGR_PEP_ID=MMETSP1464-20131121/5847_1 /ASSEMBLY_ACC=CAM_ASM_001124 /TAXON_ID=119497 /ORGANISM="Exanthemachrysis gayraliae, Strain RCC1523" /LENGTH=31 /DNA_ID= /DNA_START= /DNA_END= /DNA_ORIENTATION=